MSMAKYSAAVNQEYTPVDDDAQNVGNLHLVYDFPVQFQNQFPNARIFGIGTIPDYEFHVNETGRANVRPSFETRVDGFEPFTKEYLMPAPGVKNDVFDSRRPLPVYGIVFSLSKNDDQTVEQQYAKQNQQRSRVFHRAWVLKRGGKADEKLSTPVSVFADLRHTRDDPSRGSLISSTEMLRWIDTWDLFQAYGIPGIYLKFVQSVVTGQGFNKNSPIYIDPGAYPVTRKLPNYPAKEDPVEAPLPPKAAKLQEQYHKKHGIFAPAPPKDDRLARVFEDYHNGVMQAQVDEESGKTKLLQARAEYYDRLSERCDDGLDVFDAIKESNSDRSWKRPSTIGEPAGLEREDRAAVAQRPKAIPNAVNKKPAPVAKRKPVPKNTQLPRPNGNGPAKKAKVQRPNNSTAAAQGGPEDQAMTRGMTAERSKGKAGTKK